MADEGALVAVLTATEGAPGVRMGHLGSGSRVLLTRVCRSIAQRDVPRGEGKVTHREEMAAPRWEESAENDQRT